MRTALAITGLLAMTCAGHADPLQAMLWRARPVVLVAPTLGDARLAAQQKRFSDKADALRGYDVEVVTQTGGMSARRWKVALDAFAVILVGKDGGEKARWSAPVEPSTIFAEIDRMPMRKQEVRQR